MKKFDVVIVGGGVIGLTAALSMSRQSLRVALIESVEPPVYTHKQQPEIRVSALSARNYQWLLGYDINNHLFKDKVHRYTDMRVWDNESRAYIEFSYDVLKYDCLGVVIENSHLQYALYQQLLNEPVDMNYSQRVERIHNTDNFVEIQTTSGECYHSKLLIAADGASSSVRKQLNFSVNIENYNSHAIVGYIQCENPLTKTALQAFNFSGPVGLLPFGQNRYSFVWSLPNNTSEKFFKSPEKIFLQNLKRVINYDLGDIDLISDRGIFPLKRLFAKSFVMGRAVLVGDAAHVVHPLAGQGLNLGIEDVMELSSCVSEKLFKDNQCLGLSLRKYQRRRYALVRETSTLIDGLYHLFTNQKPYVQWVRSLGMRNINRLSPVKHWLMNQAGS